MAKKKKKGKSKEKGIWSTIPWPPAGGPYCPVLTTSNLPTFQPIGTKRKAPYDADAFQAQWTKHQKELEFPDPSPSSDHVVLGSGNGGEREHLPSSELPMMSTGPSTQPILCAEQIEVVELAAQGRNIFYTGSAGCGKSTVLHAIRRRLEDMGKKVHVVAPSGMAALAVNGTTTWRYVGWSPDSLKKPLWVLQKAPIGNPDNRVRKRLQNTDVLIIDEISMIENLFFQRLSKVMSYVRGKGRSHGPNSPFLASSKFDKPFGGVQVIVTGDLCQLPPVKPFKNCLCGREFIRCQETGVYNCSSKTDTTKKACEYESYFESDKWAFQSSTWTDCNFQHIFLRTIHRQHDTRFIRILQHCRTGRPLSQRDVDLLMKDRPVPKDAIRLFPRRHEVAELNRKKFDLLPSPPRPYPCYDWFHRSKNATKSDIEEYEARTKPDWLLIDAHFPGPLWALRDHRFDELVSLKTGMLVVLLTNLDLDAGLCNGSQGVIVGFEPFNKAQLLKCWQPAGEHASFKEELILAFFRQAERYHEFSQTRVPLGWPIVRFHGGGGYKPTTRTIYPDCQVSTVGDNSPYSLLSRTQIPLAPAWALSVHKAQGMTLNRVVVNLQSAFEDGQVYVALSRVRTLEGLKVEGQIADLRTGLPVNEEVQEFLAAWSGDPQEGEGGLGQGVKDEGGKGQDGKKVQG